LPSHNDCFLRLKEKRNVILEHWKVYRQSTQFPARVEIRLIRHPIKIHRTKIFAKKLFYYVTGHTLVNGGRGHKRSKTHTSVEHWTRFDEGRVVWRRRERWERRSKCERRPFKRRGSATRRTRWSAPALPHPKTLKNLRTGSRRDVRLGGSLPPVDWTTVATPLPAEFLNKETDHIQVHQHFFSKCQHVYEVLR